MERHFDQELADLKEHLLRMAGFAEQSVAQALKALVQRDPSLAKKVDADDSLLDKLEIEIDDRCIKLLALRQPIATDLRFITMAMKISTDLERMADLAVDISQRVLELADKPLLKPLVDIPKLTLLAQKMTRDAISSFINKDVELAKQVILCDKEADELRNLVQQELLNDYISKNKATLSRAIPLLLVARHLERICDHATNIAEEVIYMVEAIVVKHHLEKLEQ